MTDYNFYLQRTDLVAQPIKNIEEDFPGARYKEFQGLENYGKDKGVYTESFAETDQINVYKTSKPIRENITPTLTMLFMGNNRRSTYHTFVDYITSGKMAYWDNCRNRKIFFVVEEAIEPSTDLLYGSTPYIEASFKLTCLNGQATNI